MYHTLFEKSICRGQGIAPCIILLLFLCWMGMASAAEMIPVPGYYEGTTSQGKEVSFAITSNGRVINFCLTLAYSCNSCNGSKEMCFPDQQFSIKDSCFFYSYTGSNIFQLGGCVKPAARVSGFMYYISDVSCGTCNDYVTWTACCRDCSSALIVLSPNGGEQMSGGETWSVTWGSIGSVSGVAISYSADMGAAWIPVADSLASPSCENSYEWTVPSTPSDLCLMRVQALGDSSVCDTSDAPFTICGDPSFTVVIPAGGEVWKLGDTDTIFWTWEGCIDLVKLEYSADGGETWRRIIDSTPNTGAYAWKVTGSSSSRAFIRVSDASNPSASDMNDEAFRVCLPSFLEVYTPNGGEGWDAGSEQLISWGSTGCIDSVDLSYSEDGGATWIVIAESLPNFSSYDWTVPSTSSPSCLVRVRERGDSTVADVSDAVFTICAEPVLRIIRPNGGEILLNDSSHVIQWHVEGCIGSVNLDYSLDSGASWLPIDTLIPANSYIWAVPDTQAQQCLVRVEDSSDPAVFDESDSVFSICDRPGLILLGPNGGEMLRIDSLYVVRWQESGCLAEVSLAYSLDGGTSWVYMTTTDATAQEYEWAVPDTSSRNCLVMIWDASNPGLADVSDSIFSICALPRLEVISPNGGETLMIGGQYDIRWRSEGCISRVSISFSDDAGGSWSAVTTGTPNDGLFAWNIPLVTSSACLISIQALDGAAADSSNDFFSIEDFPSIQILAPDGGEEWWVGDTRVISWIWSGSISAVDIAFSTDGGSTWSVVVDDTVNTGTHPWLIPAAPSPLCLVRVADADDEAIADISNSLFVIAVARSLTLIAPNGGEVWNGGSHGEVLWSSTGAIDSIAIALSLDGGVRWGDPLVVPNTGSWSLAVPDTFSMTCVLRIHDVLHPGIADVSDDVFTLDIPRQVTVLSPNGGEIWFAESAYAITWSSSGPVSAVSIEYSYTGGLSWISIEAESPDDGFCEWTVPATPSLTCMVRVSDFNDPGVNDQSDNFFTIREHPGLTLLSPQGGEQWRAGDIRTVSWSSKGLIPAVGIAYTEGPGSPWVSIAGSTGNDGSHSWIVPNTPSDSCLMRIWAVSLPQVADTCRQPFTILPLQVTLSVDGGEGHQASTGNLVSIDVDNRMGLGRLGFTLQYEPGSLSVVSLTGTERAADMSRFFWEQPAPGRLSVSMEEGLIAAGQGPVVVVDVAISADADLGRHPLELGDCIMADSLSRETFQCLTRDGELTVHPRQTYSLQGHIRDEHDQGLPDITITMVDDMSRSVTSGADGYYELGELLGGDYTIIPSKACWTFEPPLRRYVALDSNYTEQNFVGYTLGRSTIGWVRDQGDVTLAEGALLDTFAVWFNPGLPCSLYAVETAWDSPGTVMMYIWEAGTELLAGGTAPARGTFAGGPLGQVIAGPIPFTVTGTGWQRYEFSQSAVPVIGGPDDPGKSFIVGWYKVAAAPHILGSDVFPARSHSWFGGPWTGPDGADPHEYRWGGYDENPEEAPNLEYAVRLDLSFPWCPSVVSVGLPQMSGVEGGILSVPLYIYSVVSGLGIQTYTALISFDETLLEMIECVCLPGDMTVDWADLECAEPAPGTLALTQQGATPLLGSGILVHIRFRLLSGWKECSPLTFLSFSFAEQGPPVQAADGQICVTAGSRRCYVSGLVEHYSNHLPVAGAEIALSVNSSDTTITDGSGQYRFDRLLCSLNDTVCARLTEYPDNGITAYDAALVVQGTAAIIELSPWQKIAGDVSANCAVTAYDAAIIAQRAARLLPSFPAGPWVMIPEKTTLTDDTWCGATSCLTHTQLAMDRDGQDFRAVPVGDVSGNWSSAGLMRPAWSLSILADLAVGRGESFAIPLRCDEVAGLVALDLDLTFDPEVLSIDSISAGAGNEHLSMVLCAGPGLVTLVLFGAHPACHDADLVVLHGTARGHEGASSPLRAERLLLNEIPYAAAEARITIASPLPDIYDLQQNYPNPFNPATAISYQLSAISSPLHVTLKIFNVLGQEVRTLVDEIQEPGYYQVTWDGRDTAQREVSSGVYFCRLQSGDLSLTRKMLLLR